MFIATSFVRVLRRPLEFAQYACGDYTAILASHDIQASMSRVGNPYDNAKAERFMRTLKTEQVDGTLYRDLRHARADIGPFIDKVYNGQRLHTALGYRTPSQFEDLHRAELQRRANGAAPGGAAPTSNKKTSPAGNIARTGRGRRCARSGATRRPRPTSPAPSA
jgi:hypothetical protein